MMPDSSPKKNKTMQPTYKFAKARTELVFSNGGEAWIIPQKIKNQMEVFAFVDKLPHAVLKET
jgi:hypothetical protein